MISKELLKENFEKYGWNYSEEIAERLDCYAETLVEWNEKINLTAITEPDDIVIKHFIDSLLLLEAVPIRENAKLIDVGTGAGFPAVPIAIVRQDICPTLLDSLQKRMTFLEDLCEKVGVKATFLHARAEEAGIKSIYREQFDIATARAVAHLRELAEYCLPFVKQNGYFIALKGYEIEEEAEEAAYAISQLGGKIEKILKFELSGDNKRSLVVIRKFRQTPSKYPRITAKMKKFPLNSIK